MVEGEVVRITGEAVERYVSDGPGEDMTHTGGTQCDFLMMGKPMYVWEKGHEKNIGRISSVDFCRAVVIGG